MGQVNFFKEDKNKDKKNMKICLEENPTCLCCGSDDAVSAHHIIFRSEGGDYSMGNLITLCFHCHRKAHDGLYRETFDDTSCRKTFISPISFMIKLLKRLKLDRYKEVLNKLENKRKM